MTPWRGVLAALLMLAGCMPQSAGPTHPLDGNADHPVIEVVRIVDGDTIWLREVSTGKVVSARLTGYDTPETFHPGCAMEKALGDRAKARLDQLLRQARDIAPQPHGTDKYGRLLIELTLDGRPLADIMVAEGLAVRYDGGRRIDWCAKLVKT